jgi:hypothetical protein
MLLQYNWKFKNLWRPCNFTLTQSPTGPSGQPFASRLGGQWFASWGCTHSHHGTGFLTLALSHYIGDPDMIPDHRLRKVLFACGFTATLATLLVPVPFSTQATDYGDIPLRSRKAHTRYWRGEGGGLWNSCIYL